MVSTSNEQSSAETIYKIVLVGACKTGKTHFRKVVTGNVVDTVYIPTIGFDFDTFKSDGVIVRLWDISGQLRFLDTITHQLEYADIYLVFNRDQDISQVFLEGVEQYGSPIVFINNDQTATEVKRTSDGYTLNVDSKEQTTFVMEEILKML